MKKKILLTGAGGRLGSYLREPLSNICSTLSSTDLKKDIGKQRKQLKNNVNLREKNTPKKLFKI